MKSVDDDFFKTWSPKMAWCLGLIATDGCLFSNVNAFRNVLVNKTLALGNTDKEIIDKMVNYIKSTYKIGTVKYNGRNGYGHCSDMYCVKIISSIIYDDLIALGIKERKSLDIQFPANYPVEFMADYIRGLWDGDGSVSWYQHNGIFKCRIGMGSERFIRDLDAYLVGILNLSKHTIGTRVLMNASPFFVLSLSGENARKLCRYIYHDKMGDAYLTRKLNAWKEYKRR